jgi:hypothetical protein
MYELTGNYNQVMAMLEDESTDIQVIKDTLESIECAIEVKAQNTVLLLKNLEVYSKGMGEEIKRLQAKQLSISNKATSIGNYLFSQLESTKLTEIKTTIATIKKQNNPPAVSILDENKIPRKYKIKVPATYTISKTAIAADLKANIKVRGAVLSNSFRWVIK